MVFDQCKEDAIRAHIETCDNIMFRYMTVQHFHGLLIHSKYKEGDLWIHKTFNNPMPHEVIDRLFYFDLLLAMYLIS